MYQDHPLIMSLACKAKPCMHEYQLLNENSVNAAIHTGESSNDELYSVTSSSHQVQTLVVKQDTGRLQNHCDKITIKTENHKGKDTISLDKDMVKSLLMAKSDLTVCFGTTNDTIKTENQQDSSVSSVVQENHENNMHRTYLTIVLKRITRLNF